MNNRTVLSAVAFAALAGAVWAVYSRAVDSPFVFDDGVSVVKNRSITALWPLVGGSDHLAPLSPPKDLPNSGRPLVNFSLAVNYHFGQLNPIGYHLFNYFEAHNNLALALGKLGDPEAAIDQFRQALQSKPNYVEAWANMALAQAVLKHRAEAIATAQQAIELARSQGQFKLAGEIEAWLTNYRAQQGPSPGDSPGATRIEASP